MNRNTGKTVTLLLSAALGTMVSAGVEAPFEIGTWGNFCKGAISHTFDDYPNSGASRIATTGREAFDEKNLHMTMFVVSDEQNQNSWSALKKCFEKGHEVTSHNKVHQADASGLKPSQEAIRSNIPGEKAISFAYPFGTALGDSKVLGIYVAARDAGGGDVNSTTPSNFAHISSVGFGKGSGNYKNDATSMDNFAKKAASGNGWAVAMHHGIGADSHSWATTNLDEMKKHLDFLDKNRHEIWCETFGNVARYIKERDSVSLKVKSNRDNEITLTLTDNLNDKVYDYPLSIRRTLPDGWDKVSVTQGDKAVEDSIVIVGTKKYLMFKAVPDGGDIVIKSDGVSVKRLLSNVSTVSTVVLNKKLLTINPDGFSGSALSVFLFNLRGEMVARYSSNNRTTPFSIPLNTFANSAFLVKVTDGKTTVVSRCLAQM